MGKTIASDKAAESIATMVTEWVDGGIKMGTDWRPGLASVIQLRLNRVDTQAELAALREELASANEKIDQAWNRSHAIDHKGFIPGALDAWKRPVPQHLPYDFSGNPGASATQYCNGWNDCGGYWSGHAADLQQRLADAEQRNAILQKAVDQSIEWFERMSSADGSGHADLANGIRRMTALKPTESGASE